MPVYINSYVYGRSAPRVRIACVCYSRACEARNRSDGTEGARLRELESSFLAAVNYLRRVAITSCSEKMAKQL